MIDVTIMTFAHLSCEKYISSKKNIKWIAPCSRIIKDNKFTRQFDARVSCMHEELLKPAMPGKK